MVTQQSVGSSAFYPAIAGGLPRIERAEGVYLYGPNGERYLDAAGGVGCVTSIGHAVPEVVEAMVEQARKVAFVPFVQYQTAPTLELCDLIASWTPGRLKKVMLVSGGSEVTEAAVRLARQHWVERGESGRFKVITRWQGFHGMTLGASGFGGHTGRRRKFAPMFVDHPHIPPAYRYRCQYCSEQAACTLQCADALERSIKWEGPENVAAFIAEPVVGATMGAVPAPPGYFERIREICDRWNILWIADEVMTGFGRTGRNFGVEHWGVVPDILTAAKGVSGGYSPLAVLVAGEHVIEPFERNGSNFVAGHTYAGNPLSSAVGLAVLRYIEQHRLIENGRRMGEALLARLEALRCSPIVGDVRGLGLMLGLELVRDRATRQPFPIDARAAHVLTEEARRVGLAIYPGQGGADGLEGDHVMITPPLTITDEHVDEIADGLARALTAAETRLL
ncbi:MAG: aminotransferase class III-fold pyridoxal phosphate-dependent enzyme [Chloroflexi bacterium]|nr:aminotransferase class III-fold pyridoxal phosphate-dependent enzyme [Chloroflexota bacterium]